MTSTAEWRKVLRADLRANVGYPKSQFVLAMFRTAQLLRGKYGRSIPYLLFGTVYKLAVEWVIGVELPASTRVGPGLRLRHGVGVVVNPAAVIGANVMIRQGVTIGNRKSDDDCPTIEDDVELGANAVVIGDVRVGGRSRIGAGAIVVKSVPPDSVVVNKSTTWWSAPERFRAQR